jgi:1-deoxy-D-xylulose-5-phosphate reductoisomerase
MAGRSFPTVLSAADEVAVRAFSEGKIGFLDIPAVVERVLAAHEGWAVDNFEAVAAADAWATETAAALVSSPPRV